MRVKSFPGLFLMFHLIELNWFCLLIDASPQTRVVCRVSSYEEITDLPDWYLDICTHLVFEDFYIRINVKDKENCKLQLRSEKLKDFMKKVKRHPQLKVMLSQGELDIVQFLSENRECRENTNSTVTVEDAFADFLKEMKFDGLNLVFFGSYQVLKNIQITLKENGLLFSLTFIGHRTEANDWEKVEKNIDLRLVDFINFISFKNWNKNGLVSHHSPLFNNFPLERNIRFVAIDDEIQKLKFFIQPGKIVIGIPLSSRGWTMPSNVTGTRPPVTVIGNTRLVSNREICQGIQTEGWQVFYEDVHRNISPYAVSPSTGSQRTWVSFDDPATAVFKLKYFLSNKLGGVYLDLIHSDESNNTCGFGYDPTLMAIATTLNNTLTSVKVNKNTSVRCHVAFGIGLLVVVSYVTVLIYVFVQCYLIKRRKDNLYDDVVVINENLQPSTSSMH